ncbi:MAG: phospho-sugar mutase [Lachnospiraceae bacterium]|nr:phospho-sugar mutase [Lachnospiraceae bacterium]
MAYQETYKEWCANEYFDEATRNELKSIAGDEKEMEDRFYRDLEFGTGGLRGVIGNGTNRMNIYIVRKATQGLANFILKEGTKDQGVAISHDNRRMSREFAEATALCLNANGIKTYIYPTLRPTPMLSFAVRELGCTAGVMVTASHNPPEYNGYKVYWADGAQVTAPKDKQIIEEVNAVKDWNLVKSMDKDAAEAAGLYNIIGFDVDAKYYAALRSQCINPEVIKSVAKDLKIVYSPFNGTGSIPVRRILQELGFENVYVVPEQKDPDPEFTTLEYPNPEDPKAFTYALKLAKEKDADIVLATDPDADRLGIYAKDVKTGEYKSFTGNMSAMLIAEYLLSQRKEKGLLHDNGALITTIVSTNMAFSMAKAYGLKIIEVLTGFKFIGEQIKFFEQNNNCNFYEFGFEESYGCLVGTHARDKDAIVAVMSLCEAAAYYKSKNLTLWDQMINIFETYGYFKEGQKSITMKGASGAEAIAALMEKLRSNPPKQIGSFTVEEARDYKKDVVVEMATGATHTTGLPSSNVLYYQLSEDAWCCARPSGTEPKIKFYFGVKGKSFEDAEAQYKALSDAMMAMVEA